MKVAESWRGKKITLVIEIKEPSAAGWIWENYMGERKDLGVFVECLRNGDAVEELNRFEDNCKCLEDDDE